MEPVVRRGLGNDRPADGAGSDQFLRTVDLRIHTAVVRNAERAAAFLGRPLHGAGLGIVNRHRFFAEHMLAGVQAGHRLWGV